MPVSFSKAPLRVLAAFLYLIMLRRLACTGRDESRSWSMSASFGAVVARPRFVT